MVNVGKIISRAFFLLENELNLEKKLPELEQNTYISEQS